MLCFFLLVACSGKPVRVPEDAISSLPARYSIDGLPFHPQVEDQCGPATLATMLAARGVEVDPASLRGKLYIPDKEGAITTEMIARARSYALLVYPLEPKLMAILTEVAAGNPALVLQNLGFDWIPRWHFSVVIGFDTSREIVLLRSGDEPAQEVPFELFMKTWSRADKWAVVIVRPEDLPATAEENRFVEAASELEQVGELDAALAAYLTAIAIWPDADKARFGAANVAYATEQYLQAVDLFTDFVDRQRMSATGWNNLAYSLSAVGCYTESMVAVSCAVGLEPGNVHYRESQRELSVQATGQSLSKCSIPQCPAALMSTASPVSGFSRFAVP